MRSKYERGLKQGVKPTAATRGTHSKRSIFRRTLFLMVLCGMVIFIPLGWKLWDIADTHFRYCVLLPRVRVALF